MKNLQGDDRLAGLAADWDIVVVGGGITGAGIFNEALRCGYRVLLVDAGDFGSGTSSASSKMVHGGLRYLSSGQVALTRKALREREILLRELAGLVQPLRFVFPIVRRKFPPRFLMFLLLWFYDLLAGRRTRRSWGKRDLVFLSPVLPKDQIRAAVMFEDAVTDDSRLVMRTLQEGKRRGGVCLNYVKGQKLLFTAPGGRVSGVELTCQLSGKHKEVRAQVVVNATGVWGDNLRQQVGCGQSLRPLRGSHIVIAAQALPVQHSLAFFHPEDKRPIYAYPWYGQTVIGTTDLDHGAGGFGRVQISEEECQYLLDGINANLSDGRLSKADIVATFAGLRPVIVEAVDPGNGTEPKKIKNAKKAASKASREHGIFVDRGLVSIMGGKLTTFRPMAVEAMAAIKPLLGAAVEPGGGDDFYAPVLRATTAGVGNLPAWQQQRLWGTYGNQLPAMDHGPWQKVADTTIYWQELEFALAHEQVEHLDDLLLRRSRLGLVLPRGGEQILADVKPRVLKALSWSEERWQDEVSRYRRLWTERHGVPGVVA